MVVEKLLRVLYVKRNLRNLRVFASSIRIDCPHLDIIRPVARRMSGYMDKSLPKLSTVSLQIPDDAPMFDSPVDDENNRNVENVRMQLVWDKEMKGAGKMQRHKRVAVLLLSWDPEDDDLKVKAEVSRILLIEISYV